MTKQILRWLFMNGNSLRPFFLQKDKKKTVYTFVVYSVNPKLCIIFDKYTQTT